jgi:hypothetical protein
MSSEQIEFIRRRFSLCDACEDEEIPLRQGTVKQEILAILLSITGLEQAEIWQKQVSVFCSLLTAHCLLMMWRRRVGIEPT